ncbi:MAG: DNA translocase FtsK 4TM domain-containing protein [Hyphomicrobiaceae bacterium]
MSLEYSGVRSPRLLPSQVEDRLIEMVARATGAVLLAVALFGWVSLISWKITDPSLSHTTTEPARNLLGYPGAVCSDLLIQTLGFASIFALVAPVVWGLELIGRQRLLESKIKLALFPVSVLAMAGAFSSLPSPGAWPLHHGLGGIFGDVMYALATNLFSLINGERAGLAAGFTFFGGGLAAAAHSVGLSVQDIAVMVWSGQPAPQRRDAGIWLPEPKPVRTMAEPSGWTPDVFAAAPVQEAPVPPPPRAAQPPRYPTTPATPPAPPVSPGYGATDFDAGLDHETDMASEAMARRFAPSSVAGKAGSARPAQRAQAFLKAVSPRAPEPGYRRPSVNFLKRPTVQKVTPELTQTVLRGTARLLEDVLADFGVKGEIKDIRPGPVVTMFELEPARGTKSSRIIGLADDIARSMSATSARVAIVPGRNAIGIELPNVRREPVLLREILECDAYRSGEATLPLALGKAIGGEPVMVDLARMPHLLIAGTTGSGKSVGINAMIMSLLFRLSPEECRFLMIDPKMLELSVYNGIPHLLTPVITDPQQAITALKWTVAEMEERYKRMAQLGVRSIDVFNNRVRNAQKRGELLGRTVQTGFDRQTGTPVYEREQLALEPLPYIVVVIDELADLMIVAGKEIEAAVQRLAQMARAAGIHLVMATQRPSVDILTGTIKANFPTRISFRVASKIDSRTILNEQGAEQLLGHGDMLYASGSGHLTRVHGAFVADEEVEAIVKMLREQGEPRYVEALMAAAESEDDPDERQDSSDDIYDRAVAVVLRDRKASTSYIQRRLGIGYNRAADLIERMERDGIIGAANATGKRDILLGVAGTADAMRA